MSDSHGEFIRRLTHILPGTGRIGTGQKSTGYHLEVSVLRDSIDELDRSWVGFIRRDLLEDPRKDAETESKRRSNPPTELF